MLKWPKPFRKTDIHKTISQKKKKLNNVYNHELKKLEEDMRAT